MSDEPWIAAIERALKVAKGNGAKAHPRVAAIKEAINKGRRAMGYGADDAFDAEERELLRRKSAADHGIRRCPLFDEHTLEECPVCKDLNWIDKDGQPCELD